MKQRALVFFAVFAVLFLARPVFALTPGTCADWEGNWAFTYDNASRNDNVAITSICSKPTPASPTPSCMPTDPVRDAWLCVARGMRISDNQTVQIRQISFDTSNYIYYEATDEEISAGGASTPHDLIPTETFTKCAFISSGDNYGLASGEKENCTDTTTTTTTQPTTTILSTTTTTSVSTGCIDNDGDGYGINCDKGTDCNDNNPDMNPGLDEICDDGIDNNCNGLTDEDCNGKKCPAKIAFGDYNPNLDRLRSFRDNTLIKSTIGRKVIETYYNNADRINEALESSPALRAVTRRVLEVVAPMIGR